MKRTIQQIIAAIFIVVMSGTGVRAAGGQYLTYVAYGGKDSNNCLYTVSPCATINGALAQTIVNGEIYIIGPYFDFSGVTIPNAIHITGVPGSIIHLSAFYGTPVITISAGASDSVVLRNLIIEATPSSTVSPVKFTSGGSLQLENVRIERSPVHGVEFVPTNSATLFIKDSFFIDNAQSGVIVAPSGGGSASADLVNVGALRNNIGLAVLDKSNVTVTDSAMSENRYHGFLAYSQNGSCEINIKRSTTANNGVYGVVASGATAVVFMSQASIFGNGTGVGSFGGPIFSYGNNEINGNSVDGSPTSNIGTR